MRCVGRDALLLARPASPPGAQAAPRPRKTGGSPHPFPGARGADDAAAGWLPTRVPASRNSIYPSTRSCVQ